MIGSRDAGAVGLCDADLLRKRDAQLCKLPIL